MGLQGNLKEMSVADLIQHNCNDNKTARLDIHHAGQEASLFFAAGNVVHASLGKQEGEEVVYQILAWEEGDFSLTQGIQAPRQSIERSWSGLLMEGAKRLDETDANLQNSTIDSINLEEVKPMAQKMDEILQEMGSEMNGFVAGAVCGMDGMNVAQVANAKLNPEAMTAQLTIFLKLASSANNKSGMGEMEDVLLQTEKYFIMNVFLPGDEQHYLMTAVDRKTGSIGNQRLISKVYADRLSKVIPR
jgi:predicted regulator of Ras-like GTPase activity (Roadblock/LC7/MglB family)